METTRKPMKRALPRVTRMQCPNPECGWDTTSSTDGTCFCGARLVLYPNFEVLDAIGRGEYDVTEMDVMADMLCKSVMGWRR